jgi:hypothetical protein
MQRHEATGTPLRRATTPHARPGLTQDAITWRAKPALAYFWAGATATKVVGDAKAVVDGASTAAVFTALPS